MKKLTSRKLWAAIIGAAINFFGEEFGISKDAILQITGLAGAYILGQGVADAGAGKSQTTER